MSVEDDRKKVEEELLLIRQEKLKALEAFNKYHEMRPGEFIHWYGWQKRVLELIPRYNIGVVSAPNKIGKGQPCSEPVLTEQGWKELGKTKIGDCVYGENGNLVKITGFYNKGIREVYRVVFDDGSYTLCDDEHIWSVQLPSNRFEKKYKTFGNYQLKNTKELIEYRNKYKCYGKHISIPMCKPVEFKHREVLIEPYLLGLLIGDGCFIDRLTNGSRRTSVKFTTADKEILSYMKVDFKPCNRKEHDYEYRILGIHDALRNYKLHDKKSWEKFVPEDYLYTDSISRLEILKGLLDTDGSVYGKYGTVIEYSTTSEQLAKDVTFLVQSLGGKANTKSRYTHFNYKGEKKTGRLSYRVMISIPINPFRLKRKADRFNIKQRTHNRVIRDIIPDVKQECVCISVDNPTGLYITRNFIVTHNTACISNIASSWALGYEPWTRTDKDGGNHVKRNNKWYRKSTLGKEPPVKIRITGNDWRSHINETIVPELVKWLPKDKYDTRSDNGMVCKILFDNGSTIELLSHQEKFDVFESWIGDAWIPDEPPNKEIYDAMGRGLFLNNGKVLIFTTLLSQPWIVDELLEPEIPRSDVFLIDDLTFLDNDDLKQYDTELLRTIGYNDSQIDEYFRVLLDFENKTKPQHLKEVDDYLKQCLNLN